MGFLFPSSCVLNVWKEHFCVCGSAYIHVWDKEISGCINYYDQCESHLFQLVLLVFWHGKAEVLSRPHAFRSPLVAELCPRPPICYLKK